MKAISVLLLAMGVTGCAAVGDLGAIPDATAMIDGPLVAAPPGWVDYCGRHTEDPACRP